MAQRETLLVLRVHKLAVKIICDEELVFHVKKNCNYLARGSTKRVSEHKNVSKLIITTNYVRRQSIKRDIVCDCMWLVWHVWNPILFKFL